MVQDASAGPPIQPSGGLSDLVLLVARRWRSISLVTAIATLIAVVGSLALPKWYAAEVRVLPPKRSSMGGGLSMIPSAAAAVSAVDILGLMGGSTEPAVLAQIIQSRTVSDAIITRFKLMDRYQQPTMEQCRAALWSHVAVEVERKSSVITIRAEDRSPAMARDLATAIADEADRLNNEISMTRAGHERHFLEKRLQDSKRELSAAEIALRDFSAKHKMLDVKEQTRASIQAVARVRGEIMARDVMLSYLASYAGDTEEQRLRLGRELGELKRQLAQLESGTAPSAAAQPPKGGSVVAPITELPELALEWTRLYRDLKIQETVFELLTRQYEMAKLAEVSDTANAQVIDPAVLPTRKIRPKRANYVVFGFLTGLVVALAVARFRERLAHDPATAARWRAVADALRGHEQEQQRPPEPPARPAVGGT
jgi:uncharacterized protein involved in exopolysaccharide biosynthesis